MNSKELLEQAKTKESEIHMLIDSIEDAERILNSVNEHTDICFGSPITSITFFHNSITQDSMERLKGEAIEEIIKVRGENTRELEKLIGIRKSAIINPEFEAAVREMENSGKKQLDPDPVKEKLNDILKAETVLIEIPPKDKSLDKYPAQKDLRKRLPDSMTDEAVYQMFVIDGKKPKEIAEHYGLKSSQVSNFIFQHDIKNFGKRKKPAPRVEKSDEKTEKQPDDKESHSQP